MQGVLSFGHFSYGQAKKSDSRTGGAGNRDREVMVKYWYVLSKSTVATATKPHRLMDETIAVSALLMLAKIPITTRE
ncbi:hypothetical protein TK45_08290 [Bowmanella sp. JS7-9]|nr:hypothetical protein TK45_08290 [Bowmanella sp. JS7-9]